MRKAYKNFVSGNRFVDDEGGGGVVTISSTPLA